MCYVLTEGNMVRMENIHPDLIEIKIGRVSWPLKDEHPPEDDCCSKFDLQTFCPENHARIHVAEPIVKSCKQKKQIHMMTNVIRLWTTLSDPEKIVFLASANPEEIKQIKKITNPAYLLTENMILTAQKIREERTEEENF